MLVEVGRYAIDRPNSAATALLKNVTKTTRVSGIQPASAEVKCLIGKWTEK
ncbi:unnamed protein product [Amoebophrya sp. A25]|nr:unnamed protein product [Amoebophrya sp. A25]|eukprot:GSA25T00023388001.1